MCQDLRDVDERPEERHLARVHEVSVTNGLLKARLRRCVPPDQRVDGVDPEMAAVLQEMEQVPGPGTRVSGTDPAETQDGIVHRQRVSVPVVLLAGRAEDRSRRSCQSRNGTLCVGRLQPVVVTVPPEERPPRVVERGVEFS